MRPIRFRAWDKRSKQFIPIEIGGGKYAIRIGYKGMTNAIFDIKVIWQQYTHIKDKNSVEIYEGDIVRAVGDKWEATGDVYWGEYADEEYVSNIECWMRRGNNTTTAWPISDLGGLHSVGKHSLEVIGNIYENLELLK